MKTGEQQVNTEDYMSLDGVILIDGDMEIWYAKVKYVSENNNDEINKRQSYLHGLQKDNQRNNVHASSQTLDF